MLLDFDRLGPLRWALLGVGAVVSLFLLLPVLFIVALSFGDSQWLMFPPPGWTLRWYSMLFTDPGWLDSLMTSVELGVVVMVLSVVLGLFASLALTRGNFRGRALLKAFSSHRWYCPSSFWPSRCMVFLAHRAHGNAGRIRDRAPDHCVAVFDHRHQQFA